MNWEAVFWNLWGFFWMIAFFGGSIFVHEFGHFWIAKKRGLYVPKFSIGFGPKLFSWKRGETEYCLSLLPLGGYVALPQMDKNPISGGRTRQATRPLKHTDKFLVAIMGAIFNLLFAFILACILWAVGLNISEQDHTLQIGYILPKYDGIETPAIKAGLRQGDEILAIDDTPVYSFSDIEKRIILGSSHDKNGNPQVKITFRRNGKLQSIILDLIKTKTNPLTGDEIRFSGIIAPKQDLIIKDFEAGSPAEKCGLKSGDKILQVDNLSLYSVVDLREYLNKNKPRQVKFLIERNGEQLQFECNVQTKIDKRNWLRYGNENNFIDFYDLNEAIGILDIKGDSFNPVLMDSILHACNGVRIQKLLQLEEILKTTTSRAVVLEIENKDKQKKLIIIPNMRENVVFHPAEIVQRVGIIFATPTKLIHTNPLKQFKQAFHSTFETLTCLLNKHSDVKMQHLMGAPGIMRLLHKFSIDDFRRLLLFIVILNINLAILNLLPIPVLDGGHILFIVLEKLRGEALPWKLILMVQNVFVIIFFGLMAYVIFFDIRRWQGDIQSEAEQKRLTKLMIPVEMR